MKYLIINGSPRRGNTWKVVQEVVKNIKNMDSSASIEEVHLMEENIPFCNGCSACFRTSENKCPNKDKILNIIDKIDYADGVIICSTAFTSKETGLLRNFFNHLEYMIHRPHFFKKKAIVVTTTSGIGAKSAATSIQRFLSLIGFNKCYKLAVKTYSWNNFKMTEEIERKSEKITKTFVKDLKEGKYYYPNTLMVFWYNLFRGTSKSLGTDCEYPTIDGIHWLEESRRESVYDPEIKVSILSVIIGNIIYLVGKIAGKSLVVTYKK